MFNWLSNQPVAFSIILVLLVIIAGLIITGVDEIRRAHQRVLRFQTLADESHEIVTERDIEISRLKKSLLASQNEVTDLQYLLKGGQDTVKSLQEKLARTTDALYSAKSLIAPNIRELNRPLINVELVPDIGRSIRYVDGTGQFESRMAVRFSVDPVLIYGENHENLLRLVRAKFKDRFCDLLIKIEDKIEEALKSPGTVLKSDPPHRSRKVFDIDFFTKGGPHAT